MSVAPRFVPSLAPHRNGVPQHGRQHPPLWEKPDEAVDVRPDVIPALLVLSLGGVVIYGLGWVVVLVVCAMAHWLGVW